MRMLIVMAVLAGIGAFAAYHYLHRPSAAAAHVEPAEAAKPVRSLEERAAAAQGTVYPSQRPEPQVRQGAEGSGTAPPAAPAATSQSRCDGRKYCSQMRSCDEATWFLRNCPTVKMDGDQDGVPCEQQWCPGG